MEGLVSIRDAFAGRRVLVTGDTGFKGSWLSTWLVELGAHVFGYALPPEKNSPLFVDLELPSLINHIDGDIRDLGYLQETLQNAKPEVVFHLAAQSLVKESYRDPVGTVSTNLLGSTHVLEAIRQIGSVEALVYVTTDKCYKNQEWVWGYRETDALGGHDPYSASKACAEIMFSSYLDAFCSQMPNSASVRAGNVIGGGDFAENRIVPDCMRALAENTPIQVRNPKATRPWQHVLDPLGAYLYIAAGLLAGIDRFTGSWNIGPGIESNQSVELLVRSIVSLWGKGDIEFTRSDSHKEHEANLLFLNCDKISQLLGWSPAYDLHKAVSLTVEWHREISNGAKPMKITKSQIEDYMRQSAYFG